MKVSFAGPGIPFSAAVRESAAACRPHGCLIRSVDVVPEPLYGLSCAVQLNLPQGAVAGKAEIYQGAGVADQRRPAAGHSHCDGFQHRRRSENGWPARRLTSSRASGSFRTRKSWLTGRDQIRVFPVRRQGL